MIRSGIFIIGLLAIFPFLKAGIGDTIIVIKEVRTKGVRFDEYSTGARILQLDTNIIISYQTSNIAELLAQNSLVSVRSYGPSGLANVSMRGGSSRHTAIIWNGFSLKSPMSGTMNFSSMPAGFVENIAIQSGGSSTMYGSGASTGVIFLDNTLYTGPLRTQGSVTAEVASFNTYCIGASVAQIMPRFATRLKLGYINSKNDLKYVAQTIGKPTKKLDHAAFKRFGISQQNTVHLGLKTKLESDFWYTYLFKQIPSLMTDASPGTGKQSDKNLRGAVILSHYHDKVTVKGRSGVFYDEIYFHDPEPLLIKSTNKSFSWINEIETRFKPFRGHDINIGANQTWEHGRSSGYIADTGRSRGSLYGRYKLHFFKDKWNNSFEARQEMVQGKDIPFVFSIGTQYLINNWLCLKGNLSKHYSLPIFDDLFWAEDAYAKGNPNLVPEYGWNYEAGSKIKFVQSRLSFSAEATLYQNRIHNMIIWLPGPDGKWTPTNMNNTITNGVELSTDLNMNYSITKVWGLRFLMAYTDARIFEEENQDEAEQRLYVPKWKTNISFHYEYKELNFSYIQSFESKRYFDNVGSLDPYVLTDFIINYKLSILNSNTNIFLKVKNLFNIDYQIVNGYAQPLRNYAIGANIKF